MICSQTALLLPSARQNQTTFSDYKNDDNSRKLYIYTCKRKMFPLGQKRVVVGGGCMLNLRDHYFQPLFFSHFFRTAFLSASNVGEAEMFYCTNIGKISGCRSLLHDWTVERGLGAYRTGGISNPLDTHLNCSCGFATTTTATRQKAFILIGEKIFLF